MKNSSNRLKYFVYACGLTIALTINAAQSVSDAQNQLQRISADIEQLQSKLAQSNNKRQLLLQELKKTEKQISQNLLKSHRIEKEMKHKQKKSKL